jgi:hypothetical protein
MLKTRGTEAQPMYSATNCVIKMLRFNINISCMTYWEADPLANG